MKILIAEGNLEKGKVWSNHLARQGACVKLCPDQDSAVLALTLECFDVIILNLDMADGHAVSIADYAAFRQPTAKVIFITGSTFFADGLIFSHCQNACACLSEHTAPQDLAALVDYHVGKAA